jgi:DNA-binding LacI/PurR family transcriptional regulator
MPPTLHDVAAVAGVSYRTVSNVVNRYPHVRPETRERVLRAIEAVGYRPDYAARMLRLGRTDIIRLALPELDQPYFAGFASRVIEEARLRGVVVLLEQTNSSRQRELDAVNGVGRPATDGLLLSPVLLEPADLERIPARSPVVLLGQHVFSDRLDHVTMKNVEGAALAVDHLVGLGHRRIAVLGANPRVHQGAAALRLEGYRAALARHRLEVDDTLVVSAPEWRRSDGAAAARALIESGVRFSAVFALNDTLALGALHEFERLGRPAPRGLSLVGFDDIAETALSDPPLTTVDPGWRALARLAVETLMQRRAAPAAPARLVTAEPTVVVRSTTAAPR